METPPQRWVNPMSRILMKLATSHASALPWGMPAHRVRNAPRTINLRARPRPDRTVHAAPFDIRLPGKRLNELEPEDWYPKQQVTKRQRFAFLWIGLSALRERLHRYAERRALSNATFLLGSAPDSMLEDIGVSRCEITYSVQHGRHHDPVR